MSDEDKTLAQQEIEAALMKIDWRNKVASVSTGPSRDATGRVTYPAGAEITLSTAVKQDQLIYHFSVPSASALMINIAIRAHAEWAAKNPIASGNLVGASTVGSILHVGATFAALEAGFTSIVMAYNAIEAYAVELVPSGSKYKRQTRNGKFENINADRTKKEVGLPELLRVALPQLTGVADPSTTRDWDSFERLKQLRDRVTHLTPEDVEAWTAGSPVPDSIWARVLNPARGNPARVAKQILLAVSPEKKPFWLERCPA